MKTYKVSLTTEDGELLNQRSILAYSREEEDFIWKHESNPEVHDAVVENDHFLALHMPGDELGSLGAEVAQEIRRAEL